MDYQIDFTGSIYLNNIYTETMPKLHEYFLTSQDANLVFNFSDLEFLSPNTIPHILNIADIYKSFFRNSKRIILVLSWNPKLLSYLYSLQFFYYIKRDELFEYNDEMIGGFKAYQTRNNCNLIVSHKGSSEDMIYENIEKLLRSMLIYKKIEPDLYNRNQEYLRTVLFHLIQNSNQADNGNSNAYGIFQINKYTDESKAYISIVDNGIGLRESIKRKFNIGTESPYFTNNTNTTFGYIMEAIFWRKVRPTKHGVYNVVEMVMNKKGKVGIHSSDTYLALTHGNFGNFFQQTTVSIEDPKNIIPEIKSIEWIKETIKYRGVHIDIEFPLGAKETK
jgi:hypothetical protein